MVKRKPTSSSSDLRTNAVALSVQRYETLKAQQPWGIRHIQPFFPPIQKLFKTEVRDSPQEFGFRLDESVSAIIDSTSIRTSKGHTVPVHRKTTMLLSPFKWMQGDYGSSLGLPTTEEQSAEIQRKIQDPNNAAYVGAVLSVILAQSGCPHFPKVYGVFTGVAEKHTIDISDDYADLSERSWFSSNIGKTFDIRLTEGIHASGDFNHTRGARAGILLGEEITLENVEELQAPEVLPTEPAEMNQMMRDADDTDDDESDSSSVSTSYIFGIKSCECESDEEDDEEDDDCEPFAWASFTNVPVQITVMETCTGTFHELCSANPDSNKHLDWLTQVIFALAFAQRNYGFTHNDLHSNNVMYVPTEREHMFYSCGGSFFKVPTHGYLIKLIDFERSIGSVRVIGMKEPKLFMSDHFSVEEEAGGQYNFEPWYIHKYPEIKPNPSFDLVRLATSMFWDLFPEGPGHKEYETNKVYILFMKWLTLDDNQSILFGKKDAQHDRYHGFYLYKAIARYCKNAVPRTEIMSLKSTYSVNSLPPGEYCCMIEA
uniref:Protein kinase domain-containing protein n=1 Tax=viral metagenome TaxID=1070528 RepID=A0A6C0AJC7_9ZZZZ